MFGPVEGEVRKEKPEPTASGVDMAHVGNGAPVEEEEEEVGSGHPSLPSNRLRVIPANCRTVTRRTVLQPVCSLLM